LTRVILYRLPGDNILLTVSGELLEVVLFVLTTLLLRHPTSSILRCPACERLFLRVRKQIYCSPRCAKRASMRTWRQTDRGKVYERQRGRTRYRRNIAQRLGNHVKVRTRARTQRGKGVRHDEGETTRQS
jgi:hypothetical protein